MHNNDGISCMGKSKEWTLYMFMYICILSVVNSVFSKSINFHYVHFKVRMNLSCTTSIPIWHFVTLQLIYQKPLSSQELNRSDTVHHILIPTTHRYMYHFSTGKTKIMQIRSVVQGYNLMSLTMCVQMAGFKH